MQSPLEARADVVGSLLRPPEHRSRVSGFYERGWPADRWIELGTELDKTAVGIWGAR